MSFAAVVFCQYPTHFHQLGDLLPALTARGFRTTLLLAFSQDQLGAGHVPQDVVALWGVPYPLCERFYADVFITKLVGHPSGFPPGAIRVHLPVTLTNFGKSYSDTHFKDLDAVSSAGPYQTAELKALFERHGWRKAILEIGYPRLDRDIQRANPGPRRAAGKPVVIFAPTHRYAENEDVCVLGASGPAIIEAMLGVGWKVIFRPHTDSLQDADAGVVQQIRERFGPSPDFEFDVSGDYFSVFSRSDALLTDVSGTALSFGLCFARPVIWFQPNPVVERLPGVQFGPKPAFGVRVASIAGLLEALRGYARGDVTAEMTAFRAATVAHVGSSAAKLAESLEVLLRSGTFSERLAERSRYGSG